jgi:hypothetical protein
MPEYSHWPFGGGESAQGSHGAERAKESEAEQARLTQKAAARQQMRMNRFIVGGKAHTKKQGLS